MTTENQRNMGYVLEGERYVYQQKRNDQLLLTII